MSIKRRLVLLEQISRAVEQRTDRDRLNQEELSVVVDLAMGKITKPAKPLSATALAVLPRVQQFAAVYDELARANRGSHE